MLNDLDKENKEIIILGNLNVDYLKQDNEPIKQSFELNGFSQLIKSRSTELANVCFLDVIRKAMDKGMLTGAKYVDLSKAFHTISHNVIVEKLPQYGITGISQECFCSYLFGRYHRVSYK